MPVYEYECARCGGFTALRNMSESKDAVACPDCGTAAPRVIWTAPGLAAMPAIGRIAQATNERAAHEPRRSSAHGAGCGCCKPKAASTTTAAPGMKAFPSARPWMISH